MASTTRDTVVASPVSEASTFLTIAAEIRLNIYREIFRGFKIHMYPEFSKIKHDEENFGQCTCDRHNSIKATVKIR